jgi:glycine betaine transporter
MSIVAAFPFMILMVFMAGALLKSLRNEKRQMELHEALMKERLQRLLEQHEGHEFSDSEMQDVAEYVGENTAQPGSVVTGGAEAKGRLP